VTRARLERTSGALLGTPCPAKGILVRASMQTIRFQP